VLRCLNQAIHEVLVLVAVSNLDVLKHTAGTLDCERFVTNNVTNGLNLVATRNNGFPLLLVLCLE
jgi:hypothetical protein